jgi:hypothetical protein
LPKIAGARFQTTEGARLSSYTSSDMGRDDDFWHRLIACTHLVDKARMIWKQRLITTATSKDVLGFFQELKTIRDLCVHPGNEAKSLEALPKERLAQ